jgi:pimeloyl-ACP methyl ester carboxylesterase
MVVRGTTLAWTELGAGPPLLLLHGVGDSHRTWRRVARPLSEHFRVLLLDLPGHGLSDRPDAPYTLDWYASMVHGWLDAIGVQRTAVMGHSFGGGVAQWMVLAQRSRIDRLALLAPGGLGRTVNFGLRVSLFPVLGRLLTQPLMKLGTHAMMRVGIGGTVPLDPKEIALCAGRNALPGSGRAFHRTVAACMDLSGQRVQAWERIHEVESLPPLAVFWGIRDRIIPVGHCYAAQKRIGGAELYTYPEAGHFVHIEATEAFLRDVLPFLHAPSPPSPHLLDQELLARWQAARATA